MIYQNKPTVKLRQSPASMSMSGPNVKLKPQTLSGPNLPPTQSDIDRFMLLDPPLSTPDLDAIINWHRNQRAKREQSDKPSTQEFDISKLFKPTQPKPAAPNTPFLPRPK